MKYYLGIDLGGTNVRVAIVDEIGTIIKQFKAPSCAKEGPHKVTGVILNLLHKLKDISFVDKIGIAVPGPVDKKQKVMTLATNLPGFVDYPLAAILEKETGKQIIIDNDANAAGLGEALVGAGKGYDSIYYVTHSTGIGGAYILNGQSVGGRRGYAGEIANIIVDCHLPKKNHLVAGAVENEISGASLLKKAQQEFGLKNVNELFLLSLSNKQAAALIDKVAYYFAQLLASIAHVVDPDIFVIGGGVATNENQFYFTKLKTYYRQLVHSGMADVDITLAKLPEPGLVGAALMAR